MHTITLASHLRDPELPLAILYSTHRGQMPAHAHDFYELVYVRRGRGIHHIDNRSYPIIAGDFYLMRPNDSHRYDVDRDTLEIINLIFIPELFPAVDWQQLRTLPGVASFFSSGISTGHKISLQPPHDHAIESLCARIRSEIEHRSSGYRLLCRSLLSELLITVERAAADGDPDLHAGPIATAVAYLHANPEDPLSMADVATECGLTANYLGERFKAELGVSIGEYLNRLRVDRARELLAGSERSVTDIALSTGFDSASYFGKVFLRLTGHTPRNYRRLTRG